MIFGTDTSAYQAVGSYAPGAFEIINALDPTLPQKVSSERPWGVYSWVFPGEDGAYTAARAFAAVNRAGSAPPLGLWWDYEDNGVVQSQLDQAFAASDREGFWSGYYSNEWRVDHSTLLTRPFWLAAYPDPNDGVWRDGYSANSRRPVNIWQWTSSNGTLDQNVIIDEAWYQSIGAPTQRALEAEVGFIRHTTDGHTEWTNGWSFYWDPQGSFDQLPADRVDALPDPIWQEVHDNAAARAAQLAASMGEASSVPVDKSALVAALADEQTAHEKVAAAVAAL